MLYFRFVHPKDLVLLYPVQVPGVRWRPMNVLVIRVNTAERAWIK